MLFGYGCCCEYELLEVGFYLFVCGEVVEWILFEVDECFVNLILEENDDCEGYEDDGLFE